MIEGPRDESPGRRKRQERRYGDDYGDSRLDKGSRYSNYRRDDYDGSYSRRDDYRDGRYRNSDRRMDSEGYYYDQRGGRDCYDDMSANRQQTKYRKAAEIEKRIPCSSLSLGDAESFARLLLLPSDVIQNVLLQLANNNKQALVGSLRFISP